MGHLYIKKNNVAQRYVQLKKDGTPSQRTNKKKAEEDGAREGITSLIGRHMDQGYLMGWAGKLGQEAAFEASGFQILPHMKDAAKRLYREKTEDAANRGTAIHDAIEQHINTGRFSSSPIERNAQEQVGLWLDGLGVKNTKAEHCVLFENGITVVRYDEQYRLPLACGATADLITQQYCIDWKTVEESGGKYYTGKAAHCAQLAFCRHAAAQDGLCNRDATCINVYIDRKDGGIVAIREWTEQELNVGLEFTAWAYNTSECLKQLEAEIKENA